MASSATAAAAAVGHRLVVYALPGSQYVAATLAGLASREIQYALTFCNIDAKKRAKELPSEGNSTSVPEILYSKNKDNSNAQAVADSKEIFGFLDQAYSLEHPFIPASAKESEESAAAYEALHRNATVILDSYVNYYNWVFQETFEKTIVPRVVTKLPLQGALGPKGFMSGFGKWATKQLLAGPRKKLKAKINGVLQICAPEEAQKTVNDDIEPKMYEGLVKLLTTELAPYVLQRRKANPDEYHRQMTSVECYVFAMTHRLMGDLDMDFPNTVGDRLRSVEELQEFVVWFDETHKRVPLRWFGLRESQVYPDTAE